MSLTEDRIKVDLSDLKDYLKIEYNEDDALLTSLVKTAKELAILYLNDDFTTEDSTGNTVELPIPFTVNLACYRMVANWYEHRVGGIKLKTVGGIQYQMSEIPQDALSLLCMHRKNVGT
jgi:hypothetical protein